MIPKVNTGTPVIFALIDLKTAFDLINHTLLLAKLKHYGIRGLPLQWLSSYLHNRKQKTKVNNKYSDFQPISAGVPQGSILGPLLFILFINDIFQLQANNIEIYLYADDTAIIFSADNDMALQLLVNDFFIKYAAWCVNNCIAINPKKSNYLSFNACNITL